MNRDRLLQQLKDDEGFCAKAKWGIKQWSYGYGCRGRNRRGTSKMKIWIAAIVVLGAFVAVTQQR